MKRALLGFLLGVGLTCCSLYLVDIGHGTYAGFGFSGALLAFLFDLGPVIPTVAIPLLWAMYFLLIPDIESRVMKISAFISVPLLHLMIGGLLAFDDPSFERASQTLLTILALLFVVTIALLAYVTFRRRPE